MEEPEPGAGILVGLKAALTPKGRPLAVKEMELLKPPEMVVVMVEFPELPGATVRELGLADNEKLGLPPLTVSVTLVVSVNPPPVPVMLTV